MPKAGGSAIGSSRIGTCAGDVYITGGSLTVISDWLAGVGLGAVPPEGASAGRVIVTGGSFKAARTPNSYYGAGDNPDLASNGVSWPTYPDDSLVTSEIVTADGSPAALLTLDTGLVSSGNAFEVSVDGEPFYEGGLHRYVYTDASETIANFGQDNDDTCLYLYLPKTDHYLTVNGRELEAVWDVEADAFTVLLIGDPGSGDVDGDGTVTVSDALVVARATVGVTSLTAAQLAACDMDGDGTLSMADAIAIVRRAVGL
ncbi:MAG: dockerin type I repeat-containing protein [Coriobacteriales bacterium]|nr:dockerin type I repeat-containing protein [Coriobacteriales bacterium]